MWAVTMLILPSFAIGAQSSETNWQIEWERAVQAGKREGKVVVSIPAGAELKKSLEAAFTQRFGIGVESVSSRAAAIVTRIIEESRAGIRYFDAHIGGSESIVTGFLPAGVLEPIEPCWILPQVKDPKDWWGGHLWIDKAKRFAYSFQAYQTKNFWYNSDQVKPQEITSLDDFLQPKWKGKIGFLDPRTPGSGSSIWSYMRQVKGENYLKKLVAQKMLLSRDQRILAENLARGKISLLIGLTYYSVSPFIKAGLPVRPLPAPREGLYVSAGSGNLTIMKNPPHPNALKVFVNWLLSNEGQETFGKAIGQASRRFDVDTKRLEEFGVIPAKDHLTLEQYHRLENQSEEKIYEVRDPGAELARKLLE